MGRLFKALLVILVLGFLGLTGYAYFGDLAPERVEVTEPVTLDAD